MAPDPLRADRLRLGHRRRRDVPLPPGRRSSSGAAPSRPATSGEPYISFSEIDHIMKDQMLLGQEGMGVYVSGWHRGVEGQIQKLIAFTPVPSAALGRGAGVVGGGGGAHHGGGARRCAASTAASSRPRPPSSSGMLVLGLLAIADQRRLSAALARQMGRQEEYMLSILNSSADAIVFVDNEQPRPGLEPGRGAALRLHRRGDGRAHLPPPRPPGDRRRGGAAAHPGGGGPQGLRPGLRGHPHHQGRAAGSRSTSPAPRCSRRRAR